MNRRLALLACVVAGSLACRRPFSRASADDAAASALPSTAPVTTVASPPPSQSSPAAGPAPKGSASPAERQRAVASLLSGEWSTAELPEVATPPNEDFDLQLRQRLTTVTVTVDGGVEGPRPEVQLWAGVSTVPIPNMDRTIAGLRPRFRQCYRTGLAADPTMAGKLSIVAKVLPNGEVMTADAAANSGLSPSVVACAIRMVRNAQFEPPNAASTVTIPVSFAPLN